MLVAFDHVNLRTTDVTAMTEWYQDILGLVPGPRPDFGFPGEWLYLNETAVVHLVHQDEPLERAEVSLEHFAFRATGMRDFETKLTARGIPFESKGVPGTNIVQVNLRDPMGTHLHIDFTGEN